MTRARFLVRSGGNVVTFEVQQGGAAVTPAALAFTLRAPDGTEVVDGASVTPGAMSSYTIVADLTGYAYSSDWVGEWAATIGGVVYTFVDRFVLSRAGEPAAPITEDTLKRAHSDLTRATMIPAGKTHLQDYVDIGMDEVIRKMMTGAVQPHMISDWSAVSGWVFAEAMHAYCRDVAVVEAGAGKWSQLRDYYAVKAEAEARAMASPIDRDQDGVIDTGGEAMGAASVQAVGLFGRSFA